MSLEMRKLNGQDIFPLLKIMAKVQVKAMIIDFLATQQNLSSKKHSEEEQALVGMKIFADIIETAMLNIDMAKTEINSLLASLTGVKPKEIQELDIIEYTTLLMDFFGKEELVDFFKCIFSSKILMNLK